MNTCWSFKLWPFWQLQLIHISLFVLIFVSVLLFNRRFYATDLSNALLIRRWTVFVYSALQANLGGARSPERESWAFACSCEGFSPESLCVCLAITAFSHLENKPEEPRLLEWGDLQGFCAVRDISEGVENHIKGLSAKVCGSQYFSCRNSHRFMMCTMTSTAEKTDCNNFLESFFGWPIGYQE